MGASLSLTITESSLSPSANTSKVEVKLYVKSTSGSSNSSSRSGYITIDGTKYTFSSSFKKNTTTLLATKSKTVTHDSSGGGTITIKGYYSTGVSAGNISVSKSYTLNKIDRTFTVTFDANGGEGAPSPQTKNYGKTLILSSTKPTRPGYIFRGWAITPTTIGASYQPGGSYTTESNITLYAYWVLNTAAATFYTNKLPKPSTIALTYAASATLPDITMQNGYHLTGWTNMTTGEVSQPGWLIKGSNVDPVKVDFESVEEPNLNNLNFRLDGNIIHQWFDVAYDSTIQYPTLEECGIIIPEDQTFVGWNTAKDMSGTTYPAHKNYTWKSGADKSGAYYVLHAYVKDKDAIDINFADLISFRDEASEWSATRKYFCPYGEDFVVPAIYDTPRVNNCVFTGWWKLCRNGEIDYPYNEKWKEENLSASCIYPYNFRIADNADHIDPETGYVTTGYVIQNVTEYSGITLYPVYRDDNSVSNISEINYSYEYVIDGQPNKQDVTVQNYYSYISGQTSSIDRVLYGPQFVAAWVFKSSSEDNSLVVSSVTATLRGDVSGWEDIYTWTINDFYIVRSGLYTYLILKYSDELPSYDKNEYLLIISGLLDSFGKPVSGTTIEISPPEVIRDINSAGNVVAYFTEAPEEPREYAEKEFIIDGDLTVNGRTHTGGTDDDIYTVNKLNVRQSLYTNTFSMSMLSEGDGSWDWDTINYDEEHDPEPDSIDYKLFLPWAKFYGYTGDQAKGLWRGLHNYPPGMSSEKTGGLKIEKYMQFLAEVISAVQEVQADLLNQLDPTVEGSLQAQINTASSQIDNLDERVTALEQRIEP